MLFVYKVKVNRLETASHEKERISRPDESIEQWRVVYVKAGKRRWGRYVPTDGIDRCLLDSLVEALSGESTYKYTKQAGGGGLGRPSGRNVVREPRDSDKHKGNSQSRVPVMEGI